MEGGDVIEDGVFDEKEMEIVDQLFKAGTKDRKGEAIKRRNKNQRQFVRGN